MFAKFHAKRERDERGFTLIELLVVILIIAILAAIAIPVFLRQREKGWISQTQSALKNATTAAESYVTGVPGQDGYTGMDLADLTNEGLRSAAAVTVVVSSADTTTYCLQATHSSLLDGATPRTWFMGTYNDGATPPVTGTQTSPVEGDCTDGPLP